MARFSNRFSSFVDDVEQISKRWKHFDKLFSSLLNLADKRWIIVDVITWYWEAAEIEIGHLRVHSSREFGESNGILFVK